MTLTKGQPYVIASATAISGYVKGKIALSLPNGTDANKWTLRKDGNSLVVAPKGGFSIRLR